MLNENLRKIRLEQELSKLKLSRLSNVSRNTIREIENGNFENTSLATVNKLANALHVRLTDLVK